MPMEMCTNHPDKVAHYVVFIEGKPTPICLNCRLAMGSPEDEEDD